VERWVEKNQALFRSCAWVFKKTWPDLHEEYTSVIANVPLTIGAWSTVALNCNCGAKTVHRDTKDFRDGYCWVIPFGNFEGGELFFPDLNITIKMAPEMLVAFQSFELDHCVHEYTGERYSVVFFTHQTMFF